MQAEQAAMAGRVALVTGGASGIGAATVRRLRHRHARVAVVDLQPPEEGAADLGIVADVADPEVWPVLVSRVVSALGPLDVVHLNAGVVTGESVVDRISDAQWRRVTAVNLDHVFYGIRATVPVLEGRDAVIVVTASLAGLTAFEADPAYTATKHAVVGLVRSLAGQLAARRIRIQAVCPGIVATPLIGDGAEQLRRAGFPLLSPEEVADAVLCALTSTRSGECWYVQPGRPPAPYEFRNVPGPRTPGAAGMRPPL